jgi:hypothetical protein
MTPLVYTLATPPNTAAAIACVQVRAADADALDAFVRANGVETPAGCPGLRDLLGIDEGLVIRWDTTTLDLFPHAGPAIIRRLARRLDELGLAREDAYRYPESADEAEQRMLATLAAAASPLAVDLLLDQPRRWRAHTPGGPLADDRVLRRLLTPPLVAAIGPPNIGKSTLLNTLAGRSVAIVADEAGTTRDHVGATLDLGGLVVRYLDTPGRSENAGGIDRAAIALADEAAAGADLLLACGDAASPPPEPGRPGTIRVCLRADLGEPSWSPDVLVCAHDGRGVPELVRAIRDRLVPPEALADPRPWRFWGGLPAPV